MSKLPEGYTIHQRGTVIGYCFEHNGRRYGCFATHEQAEIAARDHYEAEQSVFPQARRWANEIEHDL